MIEKLYQEKLTQKYQENFCTYRSTLLTSEELRLRTLRRVFSDVAQETGVRISRTAG